MRLVPIFSPIVSVIVPCYNYGHFLAEALESLRSQSWEFWECIIIDDGSTDNTRKVADGFIESDSRFKYVYQANQGLSAARNSGIDACIGAYIQFLDADDMLESRKMERQVAYLECHPETDIVYGNVRYFEESSDIDGTVEISRDGESWMPKSSGAGRSILSSLVNANIMVVNAPLVRRMVVEDVGGFDTKLSGHEDWDYWIRCVLVGKRFQFISEDHTCALVRVHKRSMSQSVMPMLMSLVAVREQLRLTHLPSDISKENSYQSGLILARIARLEFGKGDLLLGSRHALLALWRSHIDFGILFQLLSMLLPERVTVILKSAAKRLNVFR